jgi:uncharacterized protein
MRALTVIAFGLMVIGALNWGLKGIADYDAISAVFYAFPFVPRIIFAVIGLAGLYGIVFFNWYLNPAEHAPDQAPGHSMGHRPHPL